MADPKTNELMEKIVSLCKRRGFVFQSSEVYGGIQGFWDYGPLGTELKRNVKELWWQTMTRLRDDVVGLDATIIMHPQIWRASGHVDTFSDPMCDCLLTRKRFRADQIDPQSGVAYHYTGAKDPSTGKESSEGPTRFYCPPASRRRARARSRPSSTPPAVSPRSSCRESGPRRWRTPHDTTPRTAPFSPKPALSTSC